MSNVELYFSRNHLSTMEVNDLNYERGGIAFVGCLFIGAGIGMLFDQVTAGGAIGLGAGFLAMALLGGKGK